MNECSWEFLKTGKKAQELFAPFGNDRLPFLLESSLDVGGMGRYSFFGSDPFLVLEAKNGRCFIQEQGRRKVVPGQPLSVLRDLLKKYALTMRRPIRHPLLCGAVGFFSYDFGFSLEEIRRVHAPDSGVPDFLFGFYDCLACLDHAKKELLVFSSGFPEQGSRRARRAQARLAQFLQKLKISPVLTQNGKERAAQQGSLRSNFTRRAYLDAVGMAKEHIARGDIYQVNLSQMFQARLDIDDWLLYQKLVKNFPVSFSAFFKTPALCIISASPERFLNFDGRMVSTRPMKGTRRRTPNSVLNRRLRQELVKSNKEKAELLMIVDLERNDLGRVCDYGTINVRNLRTIEAYANVFQATAEVRGLLHPSKDRIDLLRACFPGGSITGCPKIRAMEIIEDLEPNARGIYTGALGFLSFHNTMELSILIRSFLKKDKDIFFHVGGGIVTDSEPAAEYEETLIKGKALMDALSNKC
ncbi:MAG: anthranilate synthase component I family protein [Candidatus Omnitrophota bacterium]